MTVPGPSFWDRQAAAAMAATRLAAPPTCDSSQSVRPVVRPPSPPSPTVLTSGEDSLKNALVGRLCRSRRHYLHSVRLSVMGPAAPPTWASGNSGQLLHTYIRMYAVSVWSRGRPIKYPQLHWQARIQDFAQGRGGSQKEPEVRGPEDSVPVTVPVRTFSLIVENKPVYLVHLQ